MQTMAVPARVASFNFAGTGRVSNGSLKVVTSVGATNYIWQTAAERDWLEFSRLATAWKKETGHLSSLRAKFASPHYNKIISMPCDTVVPLIIRQIELEGTSPYHWWTALRTLTGENPVPSSEQGNVQAMSTYWIEWARRRYGNQLGPRDIPQSR